MAGAKVLAMSHSRSKSANHIHYTSGLLGTLKWMGYWVASRAGNIGRAFRRHWHSEVRPALADQSDAVRERVGTALHHSGDAVASPTYDSLADAVRQRQLVDAHG